MKFFSFFIYYFNSYVVSRLYLVKKVIYLIKNLFIFVEVIEEVKAIWIKEELFVC